MEVIYKGYNIEITQGKYGWYYRITKMDSTELYISNALEDEKITYIYAKRLINEVVKQHKKEKK